MSDQPIHTERRFYYVSCIDDSSRQRKALLSGPYGSHTEALSMVPTVRRKAEEADPRACWYFFGTAGSDEALKTAFGRMSQATHADRIERDKRKADQLSQSI